ncbi:class I SAM-dependent methyltransferase [Amorphoplanes digitatis]|uniref:SAM-dependent methyltransferase n=1 Tax=Actinoplanes digitatis TaxID=1868 RepID=A0A7W7HX54_9ACTN|nr:methyltransferase domain-containing protein [Actinoplanes digitatis]MBB4762421.1 SAM-dependent methyltransferase [Actinoplanes digitatis]
MTEQTYALSARAAEFYESTFVPALFAGWARRLVDAAAPVPGSSILDVGCGTGIVARTAADRAGPGGVVGLDRGEAMLAVARRVRPDLRWLTGDAGVLPFGDASFDVVASQAALMFFADRVAALREMGRVAGPRGRVVVQVPGRLAASPGYVALTEVVARHAGTAALDLIGGYFGAGEPALFAAAGLRVERHERWRDATRMDDLDTFLTAELLPIADGVDRATHDRIVAGCRTAMAPFVDPAGAVAAPIEVDLFVASL